MIYVNKKLLDWIEEICTNEQISLEEDVMLIQPVTVDLKEVIHYIPQSERPILQGRILAAVFYIIGFQDNNLGVIIVPKIKKEFFDNKLYFVSAGSKPVSNIKLN